MELAVEVLAVSRVYGSGDRSVVALQEVSLTVPAGSVVAVLGRNGAGKTTLVKILSTLLLPSSGTARVLGHDVVADPRAVRSVSSVVLGGDRGLYPRLSGRSNLRFFGMLAGVGARRMRTAMPEMLERVGLDQVADRAVETYSRGMRQRLHIAIGLLSAPQVLLLDEPTVGLDPLEAQRLREAVRDLRTGGATVVLTSHYLLDVEELAERVVLLDAGRVVTDLPLAAFAAEAGYAAVVEVRARGRMANVSRLRPELASVDACRPTGDGWQLTLRVRQWNSEVLREISELLDLADLLDVQVRPARLEEAYARLSTQQPR